jgi:mRNA interferase RelE/StbE
MTEIRFSSAAARYFRKIRESRLREAYRKALERIAEDPFIGQPKTGDLKGIHGMDVYYMKTNYEIAYRI